MLLPNGGAGAPMVLNVSTGQPGNPGDVATGGGKMRTLRADVLRLIQLLSNICTGYNLNWKDTQVLLKELF